MEFTLGNFATAILIVGNLVIMGAVGFAGFGVVVDDGYDTELSTVLMTVMAWVCFVIALMLGWQAVVA